MAKDFDPTTAAPRDVAQAASEAPSELSIKAFAEQVAEYVATKTVSKAEVAEMFTEYHRQQAENAAKAVAGKPEEASKPDAANIYQAKTAAEWLREFGVATQTKAVESEGNAFSALCKGLAYVLVAKGDANRGMDQAVKDKALGRYEGFVSKALGVDDFSAGGALSAPQMAAEVVPELLSETAVFGDPAIMTVPVNGQMEFSYENTGPTERWTAENAAANASEPAFDQVTLRPEAVSVIVPVSKKMLRSVALASQAVERSMRRKFADAVDRKFIRGDGTLNTPMGLRYLAASANVLTVNATVSAANTERDLLRLFQAIQAGNVPASPASLRFAFSPRTWRYLFGLRGTDVHLFKAEMLAGRLLGAPIAGSSGRGISNIPENLAVTDTSETEIYLYETSGLRMGIGSELVATSSDVAAYNDSAGTVQAALSRNQMVFALSAEVGLVEVFRGLGIAVLSDVDWGV